MKSEAILITGANSGIGYLLTQHLAERGHFVYAAMRSLKDTRFPLGMNNVRVIQLDITDDQSIAAAVEEISTNCTGLYGIVNNAGVATFGSLLTCSQAEFDLVIDVNIRGTFLVTKAFAPMIIAQKGRIVTIGSIAGILADRNLSVYSMSKHAMEALTDSLSQEMSPYCVHVSIVEPGGFRTQLTDNIVARVGAVPDLPDLSNRNEPKAVVAAIERALFETHPHRRYLVVDTAGEAEKTIRKQIQQLVQLNHGHRFSLARDELIRLIDEAIHALPP